MKASTRFLRLIGLLLALAVAPTTFSQTLLTEDFTGATSSATNGTGNWLFFNGACLTAGTSTSLTSPSTSIPACTAVLISYYENAHLGDRYLVGGANGFLGGTTAPSSPSAQQPDPVGSGALRFTNGSPYGQQERGAIVSTNSYPTNSGIQVTFKTVTYGGTGADGISFYMMDGCAPVTGATPPATCAANPIYPTTTTVNGIGATGGSLAYSCSNQNGPSSGAGVTYDGLTGGYIGLGIDEYGNFLNGSVNTQGTSYAAGGDNTASGGGFKGGRIGLRGAGAISWPALHSAYGGSTNPGTGKPWYPSSLTTTQQQSAVQQACVTGKLWNWASGNISGSTGLSTASAGTTTLPTDPTTPNAANTAGILDYAAIPSAFTVLPSSQPLYNGSAATRSAATTIFYNLLITSDGYLSLSYAYNGGAYQSVIANQSIQSSNGPLPAYVRFGFAGSTGGSTNVHEILCFKSAPVVQSASSAGGNQKVSAPVETGSYAYFAYYNQSNWVGRLTANALSLDSTTGFVDIASVPTWDASCVLTGVISGQSCSTGVAGPTAAMTPASRVILSYNGGGVSFEWASLSSTQQAALTQGDPSSTAYRLNYLRGDRTNEITTAGTCSGGSAVCFRARTSILADIVDSSPTWVGPPQLAYSTLWQDKLYPAATANENSGSQSYAQYIAAEQTRPNVVYVGSNDGMMHGFRSGAENSTGTFSTATTPNDGQEVLAYMPGSLLLSASTGGACASLATTGSIVQNIHGVTPAYSTQPACVTTALDFSSVQYGHNFFVDATPGTGDLYYGGTWHTWLVSGLGAGGAAIFALDVTNPTATNFTEGNASSLVIGEWTSSSISCVSNTACGKNMGATYGTPIIRRLHDGRWAVIFGNGYGSANGDAGIFVMTIDNSGNKLFYYLSTGNTGTNKNNGIGYVVSADLDGDRVTDYVYAGDLMGNLWRFDLTSATESTWAVSTGPLFTTPTGQPITTQVTVASGSTAAGANTIVVSFGTGLRTQFTNSAPVAYQSATQSLYGVWDWNLSAWNGGSSTQYAALSASATSLASPYTLALSNLVQQTFTQNTTTGLRDINNPTAICWAGSLGCTGTAGKYGWYINLLSTLEQIVYNPQLVDGVLLVNSVVPANNLPLACATNTDTGYTYAIAVLTGSAPPNFFISYADASGAGAQTNATGTSLVVTSGTMGSGTSGSGSGPGPTPPAPPPGCTNATLIYQTTGGTAQATNACLPANTKARRLTWVQLR